MVENITPHSEKFKEVVSSGEVNFGDQIIQLFQDVAYKTIYNEQEKSWGILVLSTTETIRTSVAIESYFDLLTRDDIREYGIDTAKYKIPKPLLFLQFHENSEDTIFLDTIEVQASSQQSNIGKNILDMLENNLRKKGYTYILSIHYNKDTIGFFQRRGHIPATQSDIANMPEVKKYSDAEDGDYVTLVKKL